MPIELDRLVDRIEPIETVLLFGAGSSRPSGIPSAAETAERLALQFKFPQGQYSLSEVSSLIEHSHGRHKLITALRTVLGKANPTGGLVNLPLYEWRSIYTTNYDDLIEKCYKRHAKELVVYSSDFDFTVHQSGDNTKLFKVHGTIDKDVAEGNLSRIIVTDTDYDVTGNFRDGIFDRLKADLAGSHLVIIGHSLQDPDIRQIVTRALELSAATSGSRRISLLLYERDDNRAVLFEQRGITVAFGGIDQFFASLARKLPARSSPGDSADLLDREPALRPVTVDIEHASAAAPNFSAMFNGWPATHADIVAGLTFDRSIVDDMEKALVSDGVLASIILGASGVGKTTAARQLCQRLRSNRFLLWEHQTDHNLNVASWLRIAKLLHETDNRAVLFIDDAHQHLPEINQLIDELSTKGVANFQLLIVSTTNQWKPRIKTPVLYQSARESTMRRLDTREIDRLLRLVDSVSEISVLVEGSFSGFSRHERKRRLTERCESEMFVCLKNIFASEKFDDIILREYGDLAVPLQDLYRFVAALESSGVKVHRQLVMRLLSMPAEAVAAALVHLSEIIHEYTINHKEGIYGWKCRHYVIADIIKRYKYPDSEQLANLFGSIIDHVSPTYDVEIVSMRELCNVESGIPSIPDKEIQNRLLRKMMSAVPGERVPRHRLIRNLIDMGEFEKAETEIRIFEKDFRPDGPVARYKIRLLVERAKSTPGILEEDRLAILDQARALAVHSIRRHPYNKTLLGAYCEVGLEISRRSRNYSVFDDALRELKSSEIRLGDPDIPKMISRFEAQVKGHPFDPSGIEE